MSDGTLINESNASPRSGVRRAFIVYGVSIAIVLVLYTFGGKKLLETARQSQENERQRLVIERKQGELENEHAKLTAGLKQFETTLNSSADKQSSEQNDLLQKIRSMEDMYKSLKRQLDPLFDIAQNRMMEDNRQNAEIAAAHVLGQQVAQSLGQLQQELDQWETVRRGLLTSLDGKRIAANPDQTKRFHVLTMLTPVTQNQLDQYAARLNEILPGIKKAFQEKGISTVDAENIAYLNSIDEPVANALEQLQACQRALDLLVQETRDEPTGGNNLEQTVNDLKNQLAKEMTESQVARLNEYRMLALDRRVEVLGKAIDDQIESDTLRMIGEVTRDSEEAKELAVQIQLEIDELRRRVAAKQLKQDFQRDWPEIKSLLTPFISIGESQPAFPPNDFLPQMIVTTGENVPVSLTAIRGAQLLDPDDEKSLERMLFFGGYQYNGRPKGGFPNYTRVALKQSDSVRTSVKRAQDLLIKYGDMMVEKGLLME